MILRRYRLAGLVISTPPEEDPGTVVDPGGLSAPVVTVVGGFVPFASQTWPTPITIVTREVETGTMGDDEETWPGDGVTVMGDAEMDEPRERYGQNVEEAVTSWTCWFPYDALVEAELPIRRGDQLRIPDALHGQIVLRALADAKDVGYSHVAFRVQCQEVR